MAKRRRTGKKTVYRTRTKTVRSYVGRAKKAGGIVAGLIAGAGGSLLGRFLNLGQWNQPAADIATGYYMGNETLQTIGGRSIGAMLASGINIGGNGNGNGSNSLVG